MNDQNLKPAQPGEVRNPNGRPKGSPNRKTLLKWILSQPAEEVLPQAIVAILRAKYPNLSDMSIEEVMHLAQIAKAIDKRDTFAYTAVLDGAHGRPTQEIEVQATITKKKRPDWLTPKPEADATES